MSEGVSTVEPDDSPADQQDNEDAVSGDMTVVVLDDSREALELYEELFKDAPVRLKTFRRSELDHEFLQALVKFQPQLFIVDLLLGESRYAGYALIDQIHTAEGLEDVPIVVCSKLINDSLPAQSEKRRCSKLPGVLAALAKFPELPDAKVFLHFAREGR